MLSVSKCLSSINWIGIKGNLWSGLYQKGEDSKIHSPALCHIQNYMLEGINLFTSYEKGTFSDVFSPYFGLNVHKTTFEIPYSMLSMLLPPPKTNDLLTSPAEPWSWLAPLWQWSSRWSRATCSPSQSSTSSSSSASHRSHMLKHQKIILTQLTLLWKGTVAQDFWVSFSCLHGLVWT